MQEPVCPPGCKAHRVQLQRWIWPPWASIALLAVIAGAYGLIGNLWQYSLSTLATKAEVREGDALVREDLKEIKLMLAKALERKP